MPEAPHQIRPARSSADIDAVIGLFEAYAATLPIDLAYQDFPEELAGMPGKYAPPAGELLLARDAQGQPLGCVGLRPLASQQGFCEMKRLYVSPEGRGLGLGGALVQAIVAEARRRGYREMRLDTLPTMSTALALYKAVGFEPIERYYDSPVEETIFLALRLTPDG